MSNNTEMEKAEKKHDSASKRFPYSTNIKEWNNLDDFYEIYYNSCSSWHFVNSEEELMPLIKAD